MSSNGASLPPTPEPAPATPPAPALVAAAPARAPASAPAIAAAASLPPGERATAAVLLLAAAVLRILGVWEYRFNSDEPQHAHVVWGWTRGLVQYRDFFDNHAPLFHMLWAPVLAALGESVRTLFWLRLTMLPLYAAALAVTYAMGRRLLTRRAALWGTVLTALLPPFFLKTLEFRTDVPWTLLWLGAFQAATGGALGAGRLLVTGLLVGAAAAVSLKSSLLLACLLGSAVAAAAWGAAGREGGAGPTASAGIGGRVLAGLQAAGAALAGTLAVPLVVAVYFQSRGALGALLAGAVRHNLQVSHHGPGALKRAVILAAGVPLLMLVARWSLRAGPPALARQRLLLALTAGSYLIAMQVIWPLITSQTYLPVEPLVCLFVAAAALGGDPRRDPAAPRRRLAPPPRRLAARAAAGPVFVALALAVELCVDLLHGPGRGDQTRPATAIVEAALRLTGPGEAVLDDKGDMVFRRRAFDPVLEDITREAMAQGRIADSIPESILTSCACVATLESRRLPPRGKQFLAANFLPVGPVRVCGRWLAEEVTAGTAAAPRPRTIRFRVEVPARYVILVSAGPAHGRLDGAELTGPRQLAAGTHVFETAAPPPLALLWARAAERGYSPFATAAATSRRR